MKWYMKTLRLGQVWRKIASVQGQKSRYFSSSKNSSEEDEWILITGISGRFPSCKNICEFHEKLRQGIDMVGEQTRWKTPELGPRFGSIPDLDRFDGDFFGIRPKMVENMEVQQRKLLEVSFECIVDAGLNPEEIEGKAVGVFVAGSTRDSLEYNCLNGITKDGHSLIGVSEFMLPGRIAHSLDLKGPLLTVNSGCSSSLIALQQAVGSIRQGFCEAAIVAAAQITLSPSDTLALASLGALSPDGKCKTFDESANGYVRSEAVVAILIQKESSARRHYATIRAIGSNGNGRTDQGIMFPCARGQEALLRQIYTAAAIDPASVSYIEAHGTGTAAGDPQEVAAIYNVLCKGVSRNRPLLLGSVKSNIGHTEVAAGLCGIAKVLLAIQDAIIPANLHFTKLNTAFENKSGESLKVVDKPTPLPRGLIAISSLGLNGSNAHLVLEPGPITPLKKPHSSLPVLVTMQGRSEVGLTTAVQEVLMRKSEQSFLRLVHQALGRRNSGWDFRGFAVSGDKSAAPDVVVNQIHSKESPELWFVYPGMGSQWVGMGKDLMCFEAFAASVSSSQSTLDKLGINLQNLLWSGSDKMYTDIRLALVAITAVQIALHDLLTAIGLTPAGYVGHSAGEILCAYADGCLSKDEALLVTEARGRALREISKEPLGMAAIGVSWEAAQRICPSRIYPSCSNGKNSVSISGPLHLIRETVKMLKDQGVIAQEVETCGTAPHSKYVHSAVPLLLKYTQEVLGPRPRPRSIKWISSCVVNEDEQLKPWAKTASAEYFAHNLANPVRFHEATQHIPSNAVVVEVSPRGFFQSLLKDNLPTCTHVAPMSSSADEKANFFLKSLGTVYNMGVDIDLTALYGHADTKTKPAPANTSCVSPLVSWKHDESWPTFVQDYPTWPQQRTVMDLKDPKWKYLEGHKVGKAVLFPATAYLVLAWKHFADIHGVRMDTFPVTFHDLSFERATILKTDSQTNFDFQITRSGAFTIAESDAIVCTGQIETSCTDGPFKQLPAIEDISTENRTTYLTMEEIYQEFRLRGYDPQGEFRGVRKFSIDGKQSRICWNGNWTTFLDSVLQTILLSSTITRKTLAPTGIKTVKIAPHVVLEHTKTADNSPAEVRVVWEPYRDAAICSGVEIVSVSWATMAKAEENQGASFCRHVFSPYLLPHCGDSIGGTQHGFHKLATIISENVHGPKLEVVQVSNALNATLTKALHRALVDTTAKLVIRYDTVRYTLLSTPGSSSKSWDDQEYIIESKAWKDDDFQSSPPHLVVLGPGPTLGEFSSLIKDKSFILLPSGACVDKFAQDMKLLAEIQVDSVCYNLIRKARHARPMDVIHIRITAEDFAWVNDLQEAMKKPLGSKQRIWVTSQNEATSGILGLVRCLRAEQCGDAIRGIFDPSASLGIINFSQPSPKLREILSCDLALNVVKNGFIGTYCHVPLLAKETLPFGTCETQLCVLKPGDLSSLMWLEAPVQTTAEKTAELCQVAYAALNFKDVMMATGKLPLPTADSSLGYEFSGYDSQGNRIMGVVPCGGIATSVIAQTNFLWNVPQGWSLEDAATPMMPFLTAFYALCIRGGLSPSQSVLIHSGAGGVGQAAIHVALANHCRVFTTVGSDVKRSFIRQQFPQLADEHIFSSRNTNFEHQIKEFTNGTGVDLVLSSLTGDLELASFRCLAPYGQYLQIAASEVPKRYNRSLDEFTRKNIGIHGIAVDQLFSNEKVKHSVRSAIEEGLRAGIVKPLPRTVFRPEGVEEAFRFMMSGRHVGKILIDMKDQVALCQRESATYKLEKEGFSATSRPLSTARVGRRIQFHPDKSYVVVGGLGALGLETANWLVARGARHLVLPSRSGVTTGYQALCIRRWEEQGVSVETSKTDFSISAEVAEEFVKELNGRVPLGGIFNSALVLKDGTMDSQTEENFHAVAAPKIYITRNLDIATRKHCVNLEYFVVFSSMVSGRGYDSQSNYGYANDAMERIIETRVAYGLHGLAVQWGPIADVGIMGRIFADSRRSSDMNEFYGFVPQKISSCMETLECALLQQHPIVSSFVSANKSPSKRRNDRRDLWSSLGTIFGKKDLSKLDTQTTLSSLGMDSLTVVELRQLLERDFSHPVTVDQLKGFTIADLKNIQGVSECKRNYESGDLVHCTPIFRLHDDVIVRLDGGVETVTNIPLFLVHGNDGSAHVFQGLASRLACPAYGFQYGKYAELETIPKLAKAYVQEMRNVSPDGPYRLGGYSGGGTIAFEMATLLKEEAAKNVEHLFFLDASCDFTRNRLDQREALKKYLEGSGLLDHVATADKEQLFGKLDNDVSRCVHILQAFILHHRSIFTPEVVKAFQLGLQHSVRTLTYVPSRTFSHGTAHLIKAQASHFFSDPMYNLKPYCTGGLSCHIVKGDHYKFLSEAFVNETAEIINTVIAPDGSSF